MESSLYAETFQVSNPLTNGIELKKSIPLEMARSILLLHLALQDVNKSIIDLLRPFVTLEEFNKFRNKPKMIPKEGEKKSEKTQKHRIRSYSIYHGFLKRTISFDEEFISNIKSLIKERNDIKNGISYGIEHFVGKGIAKVDNINNINNINKIDKIDNTNKIDKVKESKGIGYLEIIEIEDIKKKVKKVKKKVKSLKDGKNRPLSKSCEELDVIRNSFYKVSKGLIVENIKVNEGRQRKRSNTLFLDKLMKLIEYFENF